MDEMAHVVDAMLRRVRVDLATDEVATCLEAFDIPSWEAVHRRGALKAKLKHLCSVVGIQAADGVSQALADTAKALCPIVQAARQHKLEVSNRQAWSWALWPQWRGQHTPKLKWKIECHLLLGFYLSLKTNTTSLERDLGELLAQLSAHSGPLSETGATMAAIMEITSEGPQCEEEFFGPSSKEGGPLQPTEFSRLCSTLWLEHFGRRFRRTYDVGAKAQGRTRSTVQGPQSKVHKPGTFAAAAAGRSQAASRIAEASAKPSSFVPGLSLPLTRAPLSLAGTRWAPGENEASASLKNFNKQTERKRNSTLAYAWRCFIWFLNTRQGPCHKSQV